MKRVLFVEDNSILLQIYAMMLDRDRDQWETSTATDAQEALRLMSQSTFDVVLSDLRMPGMSGLELLEQVRKDHPQTSRIIVSGIGDQKEAADSLRSTHQFLAKPFEVKTLRATLARISGLDAYLKDEKIKALVGGMRSMPSFPLLYLQIMKEMDSPDAGIETIASIIATDPSLTAKMLQVVNSAAWGLPQKIHDPFAAVQQLGLNTVRSLALAAHVFARFERTRIKGFDLATLWDHLMNTAHLAQQIMRGEGADAAAVADAGAAGMLHDMGKLMLAENLPEEFQRALRLEVEGNLSSPEAELEVFGATHAGVAAYLLGLWGLPAPIVEAVAFHHAPSRSELKEFSPLTAVHVANALLHENAATTRPKASLIDEHYLATLGMEDRLSGWREASELTNAPAAI